MDKSIDKIIDAYSRFVPQEFIKLMGKDNIMNVELGDHIEITMTILFSDIRDFTSISENMSPTDNFSFINSYLERMEPVIANSGGIIDKYIGDGIMALFPQGADSALKGAIGMLEELEAYNLELEKEGHKSIKIGIGINTGLMMLGIIGGRHHMESTVISDAVNLASRIESMTKNYMTSILISEHTYYSLHDPSAYHIRFVDRVRVKGKQQCQSIYEVFDKDPLKLRKAKMETKGIFEEALAHYHLKKIPEAMEMLSRCLDMAPDDTVARVYYERCRRFLETGIHESSGEAGLTVHWDDSMLIGHPLIDRQHKSLIEHANSLIEAMGSAYDYSQLNNLIEFLSNYVIEHFQTEEKLMKEIDYPFVDLQINQHRQFTDYFTAFKEEIRKDLNTHRVFLLFKAQILVTDWLLNHTTKLDRHLGRFLKSQNRII
ncbi:MAG: bacteriohemerythrin [Syntrophorhabdaceae bacterium]|nr:bacteriohemerythrin [Syntrophorhabdaceae bacterium]